MKLPFTEAGDGPALLLLHAGIADGTMWDEHLEPLAAAGQRVIAVDLPGFGEAPVGPGPVAHWEDVLETMDALDVDRASLVGSSFGAAVALRVAAVAPERISSLLLFSTAAVPEPDPSPDLLQAWKAEEGALEAGKVDEAVQAVVSAWVRPQAPEEVRNRIAAMQRANYEAHASGPEPEHAPDPLEEDPSLLERIECPALIAAGENDVIDFKTAVDGLGTSLPQAETILIPDCGHLTPFEAPEEFRRLVIAHLPQADA
ncbi:MAG TPA: alpha/beta hydrolase [Solirubrobacterales bacterium]|nr:alpha/beta hydrolase [Solirubrobacterales bacterium]